ncbi:MAG: ribbon-helix-helix domain-containing protein [Clostridiales bacterium]|jgi:hypothetical protein|nr:ribbon-helix-helix domain-containing protein [Clostridiales bacterium]
MNSKKGALRNRKAWSTTTDEELYALFKKLSIDTRIPLTKLLDEAIKDLLIKYKVPEMTQHNEIDPVIEKGKTISKTKS